MHDDMVERVARALREVFVVCDETPTDNKLTHLARAAIEAMREPTEDMVCDGDEQIIAAISDHTFALREPTPAKAAWQAMIVAALQKDASNAR